MNKFAWASIGENGKITGGKPGDQTGKEVRVGGYYDFGQKSVIRFKSKTKGRKAAKYAKALANNSAIGYNQDGRHTLFNLARDCGWNYSKLKKSLKYEKVNCDCSSFASTIINLAYGKQIVHISTTATIWGNCELSGKFKKLSIADAKKKWHKGDMPYKANCHIIMNV
jgi:hypothetical protein